VLSYSVSWYREAWWSPSWTDRLSESTQLVHSLYVSSHFYNNYFSFPSSFILWNAEEIALLLATLGKVEDPSEEIVVGAVRCLLVLALYLRVTTRHVKLVQDLLLHLVFKPAGQCSRVRFGVLWLKICPVIVSGDGICFLCRIHGIAWLSYVNIAHQCRRCLVCKRYTSSLIA